MRVLLIIVGILAGAIGLVAFAGSRLPRDHEAAMSAAIAAQPDQIWATLIDVRSHPSWRTDVRSVTVLTPAPLTWREEGSQGPMTIAVESWAPPSHMVTRIVDEGQPFGGSWEFVLAPDTAEAGRTRVTITERGWVSNPIVRFASKYVMGHYGSIDTYLRALSRKFGAEVAPTRL